MNAMLRIPLVRFSFAILASAGSILGTGCGNEITDKDIVYVGVDEVHDLWMQDQAGTRDRLLLIDPRPPSAFAAGHIPGARNIQTPEMPLDQTALDPAIARHSHLIVYGDDPGSAAASGMTKRLLRLGYEGVRLFAGGLSEWRAKGHPVD